MQTHAQARLYLPSTSMYGCIHIAVERDTRGVQLNDEQRYSFYPASPLPLISLVLEGDLRAVEKSSDAEGLRFSASSPRIGLIGPFRKPAVSWSPDAVHAIWVSIYPEALWRLWGIRAEVYMDRIVPLEGLVPDSVHDALTQIGTGDKPIFQQIESALQPMWGGLKTSDIGAADLREWIASLSQQTVLPNVGVGLRQMQRRIKAYAAQSQRELKMFARVEEVFAHGGIRHGETESLTAVASDAGYSDQSHMGREIKRVTGLSPKKFSERIRNDETFWIYRLISQYLQNKGKF